MDWFFNLLDKIVAAHIWHIIFDQYHPVDWIATAFLVVGAIYGFKQGFLRMLVLILETFVVIFLVFALEKKFALLLQNNLSFIKPSVARAVAFMMMSIVFWLLVMYLDGRAKGLFHTKLTGILKYTGGVFAGAFFLLLIWSMITQVLVYLPFQATRKPFAESGSKTGPQLYALAPSCYKLVTKPAALFEKKKAEPKK